MFSRLLSFARASLFASTLSCALFLVGAGCKLPSPPQPDVAPVQPVKWSFGESQPGAIPYNVALVDKLTAAWNARPKNYKPRTRHLRDDGNPKYTNRLFMEQSPYLRQHAHNPVNWYPWGDEAFRTARKLHRPVLLSVGYSTCHWCHVMEEESFEDPMIAQFMNTHYVAIKVDREERPDIDDVYMAAVRRMAGRGGWPMTVWLTPDRKPFFGGTYFPARSSGRGRRPGFLTLLGEQAEAFKSDPGVVSKAVTNARQVADALKSRPGSSKVPTLAARDRAVASWSGRFDDVNGGLNRAPKFPSSLGLRVLFRAAKAGNQVAQAQAELTLEKMAAGGIYDQVGGGFHRYSTDAAWLVPHFEKMLYGNALLVQAYLDGYQSSGREDFAQVARDILRYARRDMSSPGGGFYAATDADSVNPHDGKSEEGWFFTWTPSEISQVLSPAQTKLVTEAYNVTTGGNFSEHRGSAKRNILHRTKPLSEVAIALGMTVAQARSDLDAAREHLYKARLKRPHPLRDEKILTAWNGLMISAFARAGQVLNAPDDVKRAEEAAQFVLDHLLNDGRLMRSFIEDSQGGKARHVAYLDDYAFFVAGLLDLFSATSNVRWLKEAIALDAVLAEHYTDPNGGYFQTADDAEQLLARQKPITDGAVPSGNSIEAMNLLRLYEFTMDSAYEKRATTLLAGLGPALKRAGTSMSELLLALEFYRTPTKEVCVITAPGQKQQAAALLQTYAKTFAPNTVLLVTDQPEQLSASVPWLKDRVAQGGQATAYVCEGRVCDLPTSDPNIFKRQLLSTTNQIK